MCASLQMKRLSFLKNISVVSILLPLLLLLAGCETSHVIVNDVPEREANEIIVFLANKGIRAEKIKGAAAGPAGTTTNNLWSIAVEESKTTEAMASLNQQGLPRVRGQTLLDLFAKQGLMSSATEETIRYQAGLAEQIANMIRLMDGVIDAQVQLSIPPEEALPGAEKAQKPVTASVYVKHQGVLDDPNSHLITKIKRLVAGSVVGLDINNVTVVSDRARLADTALYAAAQPLTAQAKEYVSIWSIVMNKESASRFRTLFVTLTLLCIFLLLTVGWTAWKFYPLLKKRGGFKELLRPLPVQEKEIKEEAGAPAPPEE